MYMYLYIQHRTYGPAHTTRDTQHGHIQRTTDTYRTCGPAPMKKRHDSKRHDSCVHIHTYIRMYVYVYIYICTYVQNRTCGPAPIKK